MENQKISSILIPLYLSTVYPIESNPMECNPIGINSMEINEMELNPIWISSLISRTPNRSSSLALFVDEYAPVRDLDVDVIVIDD